MMLVPAYLTVSSQENPRSRTIIITGASDGIGAVAARALSGAGERVVVVGRDQGKTSAFRTRSARD
jgi:NAD(P)-dependent dehydrogenase (short-subunit alcohol dehydrogenase family)